MERLYKKSLAIILAVVVSFFSFATPANAHDTLGTRFIDTIQMENGSVSIEDIKAIQSSLSPGEKSLIGTINGYDLYAWKNLQGFSSFLLVKQNADSSGPQFSRRASTPCTLAVTAAIWALGGAAVGLLAAAGAGIYIAGVFITSQSLGALAAVMTSVAAVEEFVALYVC
ncbi:hypothetical protein [Bifidobacterium vespertilionis]|uniref:Uncharacterized protein n=1 Tax=Bifidobacterium vespertilionis TaxID=2562524 RepID=A0A5J5DRZ3_9BIFI|nr:hypothetical protein [Bifidobacterium vespertilionis]KAA8815718.1 hypothetical protein EMO90_11800 [Bifidobacterium vespertilionis]KAA8821020.1 hypothetical protein EM848_11560 [Bifidobacterium vespertilionis]